MPELLFLAMLLVYTGGAWKFWKGFRRTNFTERRIFLTLLWPILVTTNKSYRKNFNKALKGK